MIRPASIARQLGLGRLAYRLVHRPLGLISQSIKEGGPFEQRKDRAGHEAMREAAEELPPLALPPHGPAAEIAYLSGPRFWHQTLFCFVSLQLVSPFRITPVIHDDGGLDAATIDRIRRVVPWARFVMADDIEARLDRILPEGSFPSLRARRQVYPHLRKLTDIHAGSDKFTLVADSDMLFFREPAEILDWFDNPHPLYMQDVETAYGYPSAFLGGLGGIEIPEPVNVGLYALDGTTIDWDRVENWCRRQIEAYGANYLQEQALTAMLLARGGARPLPLFDYRVMPDPAEGRQPAAILHHYVANSKSAYFRHGWRQIMASAQSTAKT